MMINEQWGLCVPQACDDGAIFHTLLPAILGEHVYAAVVGVETWGAVPIDFAIVGFAKCGTSTLAANLHRHPNISMARCDDDGTCEYAIWSNAHQLEFLPTMPTLGAIDES